MAVSRRSVAALAAVSLAFGGAVVGPSTPPALAALSCLPNGETLGLSQEAVHVDTVARFSDGRVVCAVAAVENEVEAAMVRARISAYAVNASGNFVPATFTLRTFQLRYANCSASGVCGSGQAFTRCQPTACTKSTTSADPIATFVGVYHDATQPYGANTGWRTRGDRLRGDLSGPGGMTDDHCVSSGIWRYGSDQVVGAPSC
jgi:hypothetical protein